MDHSVWALQSRWFASRGRDVAALDLPGHGRSQGPPLTTIAAMADWTARAIAACDGRSRRDRRPFDGRAGRARLRRASS
jgi:alpha-beta hydrolase superfamily lysophospholipase